MNRVPFACYTVNYILFGRRRNGSYLRPGTTCDNHRHSPRIQEQLATFEERWEAWKLFRLMVHTAQQHHDNNELDFDSFCEDLFFVSPFLDRSEMRYHLCHMNQPHSLSWTDWYFLRRFWKMMIPMLPARIRDKALNAVFQFNSDCWDSWFVRFPYSFPPETRVSCLCGLWSTKPRHKYLYNALKTSRILRLFFVEHCLGPLCKRKDRKTLELLTRLEPEAIATKTPDILDHLQKNRGKTERLLEFFETLAIQ
jgi:hypothetical protein